MRFKVRSSTRTMKSLTALSFGGGRQTTAMLILAVNGEIPRPDVVLFADTGCEWPETYNYIGQHIQPFCAENDLPFAIVRRDGVDIYSYYARANALPIPNQRSCTDQFKIWPMRKYSEELGINTYQIGFSFDEAGRANKLQRYIRRVFPLIENRLTLADCQYEIQRHGWPLPLKSACFLCCFQPPSRLKLLALRHPDLFGKLRVLEDKAYKRTGYYLLGNHPVSHYAQIEQLGFDSDFGCAEGYCFR